MPKIIREAREETYLDPDAVGRVHQQMPTHECVHEWNMAGDVQAVSHAGQCDQDVAGVSESPDSGL